MECKVQDCERTDLKGQDWCGMHYERARRNNGDPTADGRAAYSARRKAKRAVAASSETKTCNVCNKTKPLNEYYSRGDWYYKHCKDCHADKMAAIKLQRRLENPPVYKRRRRSEIGPCAYEGCDLISVTALKGGPAGYYCKAHYNQWYRAKELWPLYTSRHSYLNERFRRCTTCRKVKTHEQFHLRTGGNGRQTECKTCKVFRNRFNALMAQSRIEEAVAVFNNMPTELQEKLKHRVEEAA